MGAMDQVVENPSPPVAAVVIDLRVKTFRAGVVGCAFKRKECPGASEHISGMSRS